MQQETIPEFGEFQSVPVAQPITVAELSSVVRDAVTQGHAVFPLGGRTMVDFGFSPSKPGVAVDLRGLDKVIDYPARDMTIAVQAGITIAKLQALLATENQQLPVDVPLPEQATLGGAIAVNASGPRRYGYGTLRDYVIGISFINDQGQEVKAGGRVVKNVAGYDLMKLQVGALGTLGVVTQVTLKLRPRPAARAGLRFRCAESELAGVLDSLHATTTRPTWIDVASQADEFGVLVGFEDNAEAVEWQVQRLQQEIDQLVAPATGHAERVAGAPSWWEEMFGPKSDRDTTIKVTLMPSRVASFLLRARQTVRSRWHAHAGNGIAIGHVDDLTLEQARTMLATLLDAAGPDGNVVVLRCPPSWKRELPIWGRPRGDAWLMRRVKETLDPRGIFNPGRFVGGI